MLIIYYFKKGQVIYFEKNTKLPSIGTDDCGPGNDLRMHGQEC